MTLINLSLKTVRKLLQPRQCYVLSKNQSLWTKDKTVKSPFKEIEIPNTILVEHVWRNLDRWSDKTAVICGLTHRSYTYYEVYKYSRNFAAQLRIKFKICDGDVVSIMMPNCPEYTIAVMGSLQAGAELTTVNPIYTAYEVQRQLVLSKSKLIIGVPETIKVIKEALQLAEKQLPLITVQSSKGDLPLGTASFEELIKDDTVDKSVLNEVRRNADDVSLLLYSSGTTGLPKGVELTNRNMAVSCAQQDVEGAKHYNDTTSTYQESVLAILPFYHSYGLSVMLLHKLSVGAKLVTLPKFQPASLLNLLTDQKITLLYAAPPLVLFLGSHADVKKEHLASVNKIMCGAAPVPKPDIHKVLEKTKPDVDFLQVYGLTETAPLATTHISGSRNYTSAGFALSNMSLKIVDLTTSQSLGPNETGELLIRGPQVMKGYKDNPEATKETFTEDGWFKSGDSALCDEDGELYICDRLKELIKVKGFQVPPAELESVLKEHPAVLDAGVIGIPDERTGEAPKAFIVLKRGHKADPSDIQGFVAERVAKYKRLKEVVFLDSLPKNPSGKLLRRDLMGYS